MPWKSRVIQPVTKATAEQELPHQQLWFGVLAFYRRHATMSLFFRQFVHENIIFSLAYFFNNTRFSYKKKIEHIIDAFYTSLR